MANEMQQLYIAVMLR